MEPDKIKFVPLESEKEMSGLEILQQHSAGKEYSHLLAGKEKFPIFIDANNDILSMPPIINSKSTGKITEKTKDVFIECSGYDFEALKKCLNILVTCLADMNGKIYQMEIKFKGKREITPKLDTENMKISLENTNKLLGLNLNEKQLKKLIEKMGYDYHKGMVKIPAWRNDILNEVDLIEDIAIAYGYDNFIPEIPGLSTIGSESQEEIIKRKISDIFLGLNMIEISNYHLTNKNHQFKKMMLKEKDFIEVDGSKTDYTILRKDLTHYLLKILSENTDSEYPQKIFEIGKVFTHETNSREGYAKERRSKISMFPKGKTVGVLAEDEEIFETESLSATISPGNFTEIKKILENFSKMIDVNIKFEEKEDNPPYFVNGRTAEIFLENKRIGFIGEIHPKILKNWKIKMPVALFEISLEEIFGKII